MKPFTSLVLAAILGTTATIALSESANAGYPRDYYREHRPRYRERHERVYYPKHRPEYRRDYIRGRDRSDYNRGYDRDYRYRDYRGDRDRHYYYDRDHHK